MSFPKGHKINIGNSWNIGRKLSDEHKQKLRNHMPWNKGKTSVYSEETLEKMSLAKKGLASNMLGKRHTKKTKLAISKIRKENPTRHWLGKKRPDMSLRQAGIKRPNLCGENSPRWKGGITPINKAFRKSLEYRIFRKAVFERDNYSCQECGNRNIELNMHHIKPFSLFPELRLAMDNVITLCISCHRKTDTWGARVNKIWGLTNNKIL